VTANGTANTSINFQGVYKFSGTINDSVTGRAVPGAKINIWGPDWPIPAEALADNQGNFKINDLAGVLKFQVTKDGYNPSTQTSITFNADKVQNFTLIPKTIPVENWLFPLIATSTDQMAGWNSPNGCPGAESAGQGTAMEVRNSCPTPGLRHFYIASSDLIMSQGGAGARGDSSQTCVGFQNLCGSVPQRNRGNITVHIGRLRLAGLGTTGNGIWDTRFYESDTSDTITLKFNGSWFAKGRISASEIIWDPTTGCQAPITAMATISWNTFSTDPVGQAFKADVTASSHTNFKIEMSATSQPIIFPTSGTDSCRTGVGLFLMGSGKMQPN
jgi:hypothetical protein